MVQALLVSAILAMLVMVAILVTSVVVSLRLNRIADNRQARELKEQWAMLYREHQLRKKENERAWREIAQRDQEIKEQGQRLFAESEKWFRGFAAGLADVLDLLPPSPPSKES